MFKMASVLFGIQIGSGTEIVCYTLTLARGGGTTGVITLPPHFSTDQETLSMTRPRSSLLPARPFRKHDFW